MAEHNDLGKYGENLACEYLRQQGYRILSQNYRYKKGEIDIVTQDKEDQFVFFEIKTRKGSEEAEGAVSNKKIKLLLETIEQYKIEHHIEEETFLDILTINIDSHQKPIFHHFKDIWLY